jgi:phospholipase/carboxylesterase
MKNKIIIVLMAMGLFIGFNFEASAQGNPQKMQELQKKMGKIESFMKSKKYAEAIPLMELTLKEYPNIPRLVSMLQYNLACCYSIIGKKDEAVKHLEKHMTTGIFNLNHMAKDTDLEAIRNMPQYTEIVAKAQKMLADHKKALEKIPIPKSIFHRPKDVAEDQKTPLIIFLHGMGSCPASVEKFISPMADKMKYSVLIPCGSIKMGMRPNGDPAYNWNFQDIDAIIKEIKALKNINPQEVYISGFSAGASVAMFAGLKNPDSFSGVIAFSGALQPDALATLKAPSISNKIPFYIIHGTSDKMMPFQLAANAEKYLKLKNYPVTVISFKGGHSLPKNYSEIFKKAINSFKAQKSEK